jgi:hypothetical protein
VGFRPAAFERVLRRGGFELDQPLHRGFWCGREGVSDGQDIAIMRSTGSIKQSRSASSSLFRTFRRRSG